MAESTEQYLLCYGSPSPGGTAILVHQKCRRAMML